MNYYLWINEEQAGPYTLGQLKSMWAAGQITSAMLYWHEGAPEWRALGDFVERAIAREEAPGAVPRAVPVARAQAAALEEMAVCHPQAESGWVRIVKVVAFLVPCLALVYFIIQPFLLNLAPDIYYRIHWFEMPAIHPVALILLAGIYFLPSLLAASKRHLPLVFILNLLFGWTGMVWIACILVAVFSPRIDQAN